MTGLPLKKYKNQVKFSFTNADVGFMRLWRLFITTVHYPVI